MVHDDVWDTYLALGKAPVSTDPDTFFLLPVLDQPGEHYAVFADGSYVKGWRPSS